MTEIIHIDKLIHRGLGLGRRPNGQAVFVPFSAPGEDVRVRVRTEHQSYAEAELLDVLSPSPDRRMPPCPYFGRCGGCQLMHLTYHCQSIWKARIAEEIWSNGPPVESGSRHGQEFEYRHRVRFQVASDLSGFGFAQYNTNIIVNIRDCMICAAPIRRILPHIQDELLPALRAESIHPHHITIIIVNDTPLVRLHTRRPVRTIDQQTAQHTAPYPLAFDPRPESLPAGDLDFGGLRLAVDPDVFFQAFPAAAAEVGQHLVMRLNADTRLLELYSGIGLFSLLFATRLRSVHAVEGDPAAGRLFALNQQRHAAANLTFSNQAVEHWLAESRIVSAYDAVFLDPPRTGLSPHVRHRIGQSHLNPILYLSCEIATQRRDVRSWLALGRQLSTLVIFDFFPNTFHIECLARIEGHA
ncbi:MAG TPA: TRAM domain-containing protein [Acidobacteriota bacterium]|nr:TRAM domain-containing protein [Acidobacteriota bacterium]HQM64358.1 TRAM domain-containing protein [Acidobacteriota bacterium]